MLEVDGLKVNYFTTPRIIRAVDDVSFKINEKQSLGIAGESGCGKSTLASAIMRSVTSPGKMTSRYIKFDERDISNISDREFNRDIRWKKISMVFQGALNSLDPVYTVESQMKEILKEHNFIDNISVKIKEALEQVSLESEVAKRYPHELSGGMKQRVVIAMALLLKPKILIADEPTTSLDVMVQAQIVNLLKRIKKENEMSIIFISHDLSIISEVSENIAIMYGGQLIEMGSSREILSSPKHPYTQILISSIPRLKCNKNQLSYLKGKPPDMVTRRGCNFFDRCPFAKEICRVDPPQVNLKNGSVKCWLYK